MKTLNEITEQEWKDIFNALPSVKMIGQFSKVTINKFSVSIICVVDMLDVFIEISFMDMQCYASYYSERGGVAWFPWINLTIELQKRGYLQMNDK